MMDKIILRQIVAEQAKNFAEKKDYLSRQVPEYIFSSPKVAVISGVRRCGKSTLLRQIAQSSGRPYYYLNFEDERLLDFSTEDFSLLLEIWIEVFGPREQIFFDEIQYIRGWEKFVARLFSEGYKVFISGSNAKLLSRELGTALTGRHVKMELYPFSFREFLAYHHYDLAAADFNLAVKRAEVKRFFAEYLRLGGFPETIASGATEELEQLYQDLLIRDLLVRFKIKDSKSFRSLALFLISNVGSAISFNALKKMLEFKSATTVKKYVNWLEETYLIFSIPKFDYSVRKQIVNNKKIYAIDTGLAGKVSFSFSQNRGYLLENLVFLQFKRQGAQVYYHQDGGECDFLIKEGLTIRQAVQVSENLAPANRNREIMGLLSALKKYKLPSGLILTYDQREDINIEGYLVRVRPIWEFLLQEAGEID